MTDYIEDSVLKSALELASLGMRILPLHGIVNGKCTCGGRAKCKPGKHPRISKYFKQATTNEDKLRSWFLFDFPQSNIGVLTGKTSGVWVLDVDIETGGYNSLKKLEDQYGPFPEKYRVRTGGGGEHYYFKSPSDQRIPCSVGKPGPGLDIRGDGGYALGSGSNHISGNSYSWICGPDDVDIAPAPEWLLSLIKASSKRKCRAEQLNQPEFDETFEQIVDGTRHTTLFKNFACHLRDKTISKPKVEIICQAINAYCCRPPIEGSEVTEAIDSAFSYRVRPSRMRSISDGSERVLELLKLWSGFEETDYVECSLKDIASVIGLTPEGTRKCLRQLEDFRLLDTQEIKGKPSRYTPLSSGPGQLCLF